MTAVWYVVVALGIIAALVNLTIAATRKKEPVVAGVRALAGGVSLIAAVGIFVSKQILELHPPFPLTAENVLLATGVFVFAVLLLPSYVGRGKEDATKPTLQQRAARPANATIRLTKGDVPDEWVN